MITQKYINDLAYKIIGCAIEVHKQLGPGLLESVYEKCLSYELKINGLDAEHQKKIGVVYKEIKIDTDLRIDLLVNDCIIVEIKSIDNILPIHQAQLMTYLKILKKPKGLLINFNCTNITKSLIPIVTEEFAKLPSE